MLGCVGSPRCVRRKDNWASGHTCACATPVGGSFKSILWNTIVITRIQGYALFHHALFQLPLCCLMFAFQHRYFAYSSTDQMKYTAGFLASLFGTYVYPSLPLPLSPPLSVAVSLYMLASISELVIRVGKPIITCYSNYGLTVYSNSWVYQWYSGNHG